MGSQASRYSYEKVIEKRLKRAGWQRLLGDKEQCLMGVTFQIKLHDCLNQFSHTSHSARVLGIFLPLAHDASLWEPADDTV